MDLLSPSSSGAGITGAIGEISPRKKFPLGAKPPFRKTIRFSRPPPRNLYAGYCNKTQINRTIVDGLNKMKK